MGSFSELVLSFDFREDVPADVLASFAELAVPLPADAYWGPAPPLPEPVSEPMAEWSPDYKDVGWPDPDPYEAEPWRHAWAPWLATAMGVQTVPAAALTWSELGCWNLASRCSWKCGPDTVYDALTWLGPFIDSGDDAEHPRLVGHIYFEYAPRPFLLWSKGNELVMEDLNPDDEWQW